MLLILHQYDKTTTRPLFMQYSNLSNENYNGNTMYRIIPQIKCVTCKYLGSNFGYNSVLVLKLINWYQQFSFNNT